MNMVRSITNYIVRSPRWAALLFLSLMIVTCLITLTALDDILEQYRARNASLETMSRLKTHLTQPGMSPRPSGSPFLKGQTATVASAALLQRLTSIVADAGGKVVSSEIVPQASASKDRFLVAVANCEVEHDALQKVLYDLEAGMPFLVVDQLVVSSGPGESGQLKVTLGVTGQWEGGK